MLYFIGSNVIDKGHLCYLTFDNSRLAFPEENNGSLKKIPKLVDPADYSKLGMVVGTILKS